MTTPWQSPDQPLTTPLTAPSDHTGHCEKTSCRSTSNPKTHMVQCINTDSLVCARCTMQNVRHWQGPTNVFNCQGIWHWSATGLALVWHGQMGSGEQQRNRERADSRTFPITDRIAETALIRLVLVHKDGVAGASGWELATIFKHHWPSTFFGCFP